MATATRKQREIEQREDLVVRVARDMLVTEGYLGLTMDRVAAATEYSKGTIYGHFPNKEELIAAVALSVQQLRLDLFIRAAAFDGSSRERMTAIGMALEIFVRLYPRDFQACRIIDSESIREKISETRQQSLQAGDARCMEVVGSIVRDAIAANDLELATSVTPESITFGLWSMNLGAYSLIYGDVPLERLGIDEPIEQLRQNSQRFMDGHGWKPLYKDFDFSKTVERINAEVFSDEIRRIHNA